MKIQKHMQHGFTLIELMITVAIVGILSAIAIPSYNKYVTQSRRAEAQAYMLEFAMTMERYRANCPTYNAGVVTSFTASSTNPCVDTSNVAKVKFNTNPSNSLYTFSLASSSTTAYQIKALATGIQNTRDGACKELFLTQDGTKSPPECWKK